MLIIIGLGLIFTKDFWVPNLVNKILGPQNFVIPQVQVATSTSSTTLATTSLPFMQKYTDSDFGFSFWYPKSWTINEKSGTDIQQPKPTSNWAIAPGETIVKEIDLSRFKETDQIIDVTIQEIHLSENEPITVPNGGDMATYFFSTSTNRWMHTDFDGPAPMPARTTPYNLSEKTMGGLQTLQLGLGGRGYIVPLSWTSDQNVLLFSDDNVMPGDPGLMMDTIVATDPSVATPVSVMEQNKTIYDEGLSYGAIGKSIDGGSWYTDDQYVYDSHFDIVPNANPTTFRSIDYTDKSIDSFFGTDFGTDGIYLYYQGPGYPIVVPGADPETFVLENNYSMKGVIAHDANHTYGFSQQGLKLTMDGVVVPGQ